MEEEGLGVHTHLLLHSESEVIVTVSLKSDPVSKEKRGKWGFTNNVVYFSDVKRLKCKVFMV